jgi:hypothetical protein
VFEFPNAQLEELTQPLDANTRELSVTLVFASAFGRSVLLQLALAEYVLRFSIASDYAHFAFRDACEGSAKPVTALWRATEACVWFCGPGYLLQPSSATYFAMPAAANSTCEAVPAPAQMLEFTLTAAECDPAALQRSAAVATGLMQNDTAYYLLEGNESCVYSAVLFSRNCAWNESTVLREVATALSGMQGVAVLDSNATTSCPPLRFGVTMSFAMAIWAVVPILLTACVVHIRNGRRKLAERFAPLVGHGFAAPYVRLQAMHTRSV